MTKPPDFIRLTGSSLARAARPLACSVAIHVGLGVIVVGGSAALSTSAPPRVAWLDLEPADLPPPTPAPVAAAPQPTPIRPAAVEPRPPEPRKLPPPVVSPPPDERVALAAPPTPREVAPPEPVAPSSVPPSAPVVSDTKAPEPSAASVPVPASATSPAPSGAEASLDPRPSRNGQEGSRQSTVASRSPEASASGPIVRAARPRGGYQVRPVYPESARRAGIQGTTLLRIFIERDGRVSDVSIQRSAGDQSLDQAASEAVRRWRFEPAHNSAGPVSIWALVPVEFRIGDRD